MRAFPWSPRDRLAYPAVGSCCGSCAAGGGCAGTPAEPPPRNELAEYAGVGDLLGERARPWSDAEKLNGDAEQLDVDIEHWWNALATKSDEQQKFAHDWADWLGSWRSWFSGPHDRKPILGDAILGHEVETLDKGEREFRELLRRATESLGVKTKVEPPPIGSPFEQWLEKFGVGLGSSGKWVLPIGFGILALVLLGPSLGPVLGAFFAHRAAATAVKAAAPKLAAGAV